MKKNTIANQEFPVKEEDKIPLYEKLAYGAGDIFGGGQGSMLSLLLLFFFTDILGINSAVAGTAIMISKIWDAIIDPTFGVISDNTRTRLGRRRPYIIIGGALIIPAMAVLFAPIQGFSEVGKSIWICFAYLFYCSVSSLSQVPYNSLSSDISPDYRERNKANTFKLVFDLFAAGLCFLIPSLLLNSYKSGDISTLTFTLALVLGIGSLFSIPLVIAGIVVKERSPYDKLYKEKFNFKEYFGTIKIKSFRLLLIMYVCAYICMDVISALALYYTSNILRGVTLFGKEMGTLYVIGPLMVCAAIAVPFAYLFMRKKSKQFAYRFGIPLFIISGIMIAVYNTSWPAYLVPVFAITAGLGFGGSQIMPWLMFPDTVDVAELKLNKRPAGSMGGIMTFCRTVTTAFATALVAWVLGAAGYQESVAGEMVIQNDKVLLAIRLLMALTITLLFSIGFIASLQYKINDKKLARIRYFSDKKREGNYDTLTDEEKQEHDKLIKELC
jgi:Na+/melibiose symporter-like transporter